MKSVAIVVVLLGVASLVALAGLTMVGERRRGQSLAVAAVAGLLFPLTWIAWYVFDELLSRRPTRAC